LLLHTYGEAVVALAVVIDSAAATAAVAAIRDINSRWPTVIF
jgi:hypothetical protein